jgi:hypothetical protein
MAKERRFPAIDLWNPRCWKDYPDVSDNQNVKRQMDEDDAVSYFFCDYKNVATHDPSNILKSLAKQLALQGQGVFSILEKFYDRFHSEGSLPTVPSPEELRDLVVAICQSFSHTFIIVDGLDECTGDRS